MTKLTADHLARGAYVYVRQSTADQLRHNHESRRRQYGLADRARALGFSEVVVIDDDLGVSASGVARPGFERLLAAICSGLVGAVVSIEASRLARNGRDWHTLLEFCALVGSVLIDEDGIYEPRSANDRLLLGMKGTMSEMELSILRQRSVEALKLKANRGDLHTTVAIGFVRSDGDRLEKDPDLRVREAIRVVFGKFAELQSVRQVLLWFRQESIALPALVNGPLGRAVQWRLPVYPTVLKILKNPVYAGAYAFGKTETRVTIEGGRKRVVRGHSKPREKWEVLIPQHHDGYIDWQTYEHNQRVIADNTNMKGEMARGSVRGGEALLAGLLRCGHCGRKLHVAYSGVGSTVSRYHCRGANGNHGSAEKCISFGAMRIDRDVGAEVLRALQPLGVEAALLAIEQRAVDGSAKRRQVELALQQARFEALRAHRQFDAVDPDNRLVSGELERRWNERLGIVAQFEMQLQNLDNDHDSELTPELRQRLLDMGADLQFVWEHPSASNETRKSILRTILKEILVRVTESQLQLVIHWQGGDHTTLTVVKNRTGTHRWTTDEHVEKLIRDLARQLPDGSVAAILNRMGHRTARGNTWTEGRLRTFRHDHHIDVYREGEREARGEMTLEQTAQVLGTSKMSVLRMIAAGEIAAHQTCRGAPWAIRHDDLAKLARRPSGRNAIGPRTTNPNQKVIDFQ